MQPSRQLVHDVQHFLDRLSAAVTKGDGAAAAELWETPALVMGDDMSMSVATPEEIAKFFGGAKDQYDERGITDTRAEILGLEDLTPKIVLVTVRFPWLDKDGEEVGGETSTYALRRDTTGALKLHFAAMHGAEN